jgi:hypothetical protein
VNDFIFNHFLFIFTITAIAAALLLPYLRARALEKAVNLPVIQGAALFWSEALKRDEDGTVTDEKALHFKERLAEILAHHYVTNGKSLPNIGHFFWRLHDLSPDPILSEATRTIPLYENRRPSFFPMIEMKLTEGGIAIRRILESDTFQIAWEPGETLEKLASLGQQHRAC